MKNAIVHRVYDFLKEFPPFNMMIAKDLWRIAEEVKVMYAPQDEILFSVGDKPGTHFYIVVEGAMQLFQDDGTMVDICDEGDLLGLRPLLAQSPYLLKAIASEESLLYAIPTGIFEPIMDENPRIARYIATSFAVGVGNRYHQSSDSFSLSESHLFNHIVSVDGYTKPVFTHSDIPIREAAQIMTEKKISSIVICDKGRRPRGIVTDKDLRSKVVAGDILNTAPVSLIMSSPVLCVPPFLTLAEMQMMMLRHRVSHLVVTEDGTDRKIMMGVISKHDLVVVQNDNPAALLKDMQKAQNIHHVKKLRASLDKIIARYVKSDVPMKFILEVTSEINDTLLRKVIELSEKKLDPDYYQKVDYAFIVLGSMARKEQLLMTDQDSAIIYREDDARGQIKEKLLALAREIVHTLHFIGFDYCPAGMMASNPLYCQSLSDWEKTFHKWIHQPGEKEVMMSTIFFDFRAVYGQTDLTERLSKFIFKNLDKQQVFLRHLAQNALANPAPLSFFRKFMVEKSGEHKDTFDIKLRAMMPLVDAARLFILQKQISGVHSTIERFRKLSETETHHKELFVFAADAFETLVKTRSFHGIENRDSGRYIYPSKMDKMDRIQLRNAFQPIHDIQDIIKVRFVL